MIVATSQEKLDYQILLINWDLMNNIKYLVGSLSLIAFVSLVNQIPIMYNTSNFLTLLLIHSINMLHQIHNKSLLQLAIVYKQLLHQIFKQSMLVLYSHNDRENATPQSTSHVGPLE